MRYLFKNQNSHFVKMIYNKYSAKKCILKIYFMKKRLVFNFFNAGHFKYATIKIIKNCFL